MSVPRYKLIALICAVLFVLAAWAANEAEAAYHEYPTWGNVCRYDEPHTCIADCVFAAMADWEVVDLHYTPSEQTVEEAFGHALGNPAVGITTARAVRWFNRHGLAGVPLRAREYEYPTRKLAEHLIRKYRVVLGAIWSHMVTITGYDRTGLTYITYGETRHMSWQEWEWSEELVTVSVKGQS